MNTKNKILIDRLLGTFIAFPMNYLVRLVGLFAGIDHSLNKQKKRIAICKFKGMGSIIQSTPLINTLRDRFPDAKIVFISSKENKAILDKITIVDEVLFVNDSGIFQLITSSAKLIIKLWRKRPDLYIDLEIYSNYSSIITTLSMSTDRFGYYLNSSRYRMGLYTHMMYFNTNAPITEVYLQFARLLGCEKINSTPYYFETDNSILVEHQNYVIINPNASDLRVERRWPSDYFIKLIQEIRGNYPDLKVILVGGPSEKEYVATISSQFSDQMIIDLAGKTSLSGLIEYIRNAKFVITNDTGPMHIASSMNKKTIALFGPCSPQQYAVGENLYPIYKNLYCSPCVHEFLVPPCKGNNQCMKSIGVDEVVRAIELIQDHRIEVRTQNSKQYAIDSNYPLGLVLRKKQPKP